MPERKDRGHNYDAVTDLVAERVESSKGRISAKRLLPAATVAGYGGSARNFRWLVAEQKALWRQGNPRGSRPAVWTPGDTLVIDWGVLDGCMCSARCWPGRGCGLFASPTTNAPRPPCRCWPSVRDARRGPEDRARRSDGLPESRGRRRCSRADRGLRAARHPLPVSAGLLPAADPESKASWRTWSVMPNMTRMIPEQPSATDLTAANVAATAWCQPVNRRRTRISARSRPSGSRPNGCCSGRCRSWGARSRPSALRPTKACACAWSACAGGCR